MVLERNLRLLAPVIKVADICIDLGQTQRLIVRFKPSLGGARDFHRFVVLSHHVQRRYESQPSPRCLFAAPAALEQRNRLLIVVDGLLVLFVGIERVRHQAARFREKGAIIGLRSDL